jgi:phosphoribosylformylglycinamidine synthase
MIHFIQSNSAQIPGGDAGVVRVGPNKAIALTTDVTPRYVEADPFEGGKQAVAESWRNLTCVGAEPIAITDNLNFGNPEKPEIMGQLVFAIKGIDAACRALAYPSFRKRLALQRDQRPAILPTPPSAASGCSGPSKMTTLAFRRREAISCWWHGHIWPVNLSQGSLGREEGSPARRSGKEKAHGDLVRNS